MENGTVRNNYCLKPMQSCLKVTKPTYVQLQYQFVYYYAVSLPFTPVFSKYSALTIFLLLLYNSFGNQIRNG